MLFFIGYSAFINVSLFAYPVLTAMLAGINIPILALVKLKLLEVECHIRVAGQW